MALISCPECNREVSDKAAACPNCGIAIANSEPEPPAPDLCPECNNEITDIDTFCPNCGIGLSIQPEIASEPQKVEVTAIKLKKPPLTEQMKKIIIASGAVVLALILGIIIFNYVSQRNAARTEMEHFNEYVDTLQSTSLLMMLRASDAETVANMTARVWNNAIRKESDRTTDPFTKIGGSFVDDFNTALLLYFFDDDTVEKTDSIKESQSLVRERMRELQNPPEGCERAYDSINDLYQAFTTLTDLAVNPTGSYTSFNSAKNEAITAFTSAYRQLQTMIPDKHDLD